MLRLMLTTAILGVSLACHSFAADPSNLLLIAGSPSHGYGSHEHYAGLKILEESLLSIQENLEIRWCEDGRRMTLWSKLLTPS